MAGANLTDHGARHGNVRVYDRADAPRRSKYLLPAVIIVVALAATAAAADDLLEPEKAFRMSARALDPTRVEVRFAIADGYYMYREKFRFALEGAGDSRLGAPEFPSGTKKTDAFFATEVVSRP